MKLVLAAALVALSFPAFAQTAQQSQNEAYSGAQSNVYMNNPDNIRSTLRTAPGIGGGGLTTSNDTCAGSFMLGGSIIGGGGIAGKTYEMEACVRMKEAIFLEQKGYSRGSTARICQGKKVSEAMWVAGTPCPQDEQRYQAAVAKAQPAAQAAPQVKRMRIADMPAGTRYRDPNTGRIVTKR
jgi:hypothetical protein